MIPDPTPVIAGFHIGAATISATAGLSLWLIKTLGSWSSNVYMTCIHC